MSTGLAIVVVVVAAIVCAAAGYFARKYLGEAKIRSAEEAAAKIVQDAERDAEAIKREARVEVKDELHQLRTKAEAEVKERRQALAQLEHRLLSAKRDWTSCRKT
jgi:ribonuclease Y